ncbi:hypothetical protein BJ978_000977 [Agromyces terreus]|uniref:Uncharacterized protein n=1 Tax=Agromyces terreus TaxID=424795 RepID=A0A9X2KBF1_9MICO|nr:hypothetical protein [Agromyces terreus]MCP2370301.1 hypothetical protein [Agromyces terreus]
MVNPSEIVRRGQSHGSDKFDATTTKNLVVAVPQRPQKIVTPVASGHQVKSIKPVGSTKRNPPDRSADDATVTEYTPIGIGQPLKITLEQLYVGDLPLPDGELLVYSRTKNPDDGAEAAFAFHWLGQDVRPRSHPEMSDGSAGSAVVYYSPAESATKLELSVQIKFDYFPKEVAEAWRTAILNIGRLPILLGGFGFGPGGAAAAQAIVGVADAGSELVINLIDQSIDGSEAEKMGGALTIAHPGRTEAQAGYLVLTPNDYRVVSKGASGSSVLTGYTSNDGYESAKGAEHHESINIDGAEFFVSSSDGQLKHATDGRWPDNKRYKQGETVEGPWHYAVILIDGAEDPDLKKWKPAAVTADLAAKFLNRSKDADLPSMTEKVFSSYSDAVMITRATELEAEIRKATKKADSAEAAGDEKAKAKSEKAKELLQKQRTAVLDAIQNDKLKDLVTGEE